MKITNSDWKISRSGHSHIENRNGWTEGSVFTQHGIVSVYAQGDKENCYVTRLDFVWNGRCYSRTYNGKRYSPRGIKTIARKFAEEIAKGAGNDD